MTLPVAEHHFSTLVPRATEPLGPHQRANGVVLAEEGIVPASAGEREFIFRRIEVSGAGEGAVHIDIAGPAAGDGPGILRAGSLDALGPNEVAFRVQLGDVAVPTVGGVQDGDASGAMPKRTVLLIQPVT